MKYAVTGGTGFIGRHFIHSLIMDNHDVYVLTRKKGQINSEFKCKVVEVDFYDFDSLHANLQEIKPDFIVHLASGKLRGDLCQLESCNGLDEILMAANLGKSAVQLESLKLFLFVGSSDEFDFSVKSGIDLEVYRPSNFYGYIKCCSSLLFNMLKRTHRLPVIELVPSIIYGPNQGTEMFIPYLIDQLIKGHEVKVSPCGQYRDFLHVNDFVSAMQVVIDTHTELHYGSRYIVSSDSAIQLLDIIEYLRKYTSRAHLINVGGIEYRPGEKMSWAASNSHFKRDFNWQPVVSLEEGLRELIAKIDKD